MIKFREFRSRKNIFRLGALLLGCIWLLIIGWVMWIGYFTNPTVTYRASQQLKSFTVDIDFRDEPLDQVVESLFIRLNAEQSFFSKWDYHFESVDDLSTPISLELANVPLSEALRYTLSLAGLKYYNDGKNIVIAPIDGSQKLAHRTYKFPTKLECAAHFPDHQTRGKHDVSEELDKHGISFPDGASAILRPEKLRLYTYTTRDQYELIEACLDGLHIHRKPTKQEIVTWTIRSWFDDYIIRKPAHKSFPMPHSTLASWGGASSGTPYTPPPPLPYYNLSDDPFADGYDPFADVPTQISPAPKNP
ncbi:MAG: STN domain-containing protein [Verrucomicrobiota bacterium]